MHGWTQAIDVHKHMQTVGSCVPTRSKEDGSTACTPVESIGRTCLKVKSEIAQKKQREGDASTVSSLLLFHSLRSRIRFIPMLVIAVLATLCWDCCLHTGMDILSAPIDRRAPFVGESTSCQFYSTSLCSSRSLFYSSLPFRISSLDCTKYSVLNRFTLMEMNLRSSCLIQEACMGSMPSDEGGLSPPFKPPLRPP